MKGIEDGGKDVGCMCKVERVEEIRKVKSSREGVGRRRKSRSCLRVSSKAIITLGLAETAVVRSHHITHYCW